MEKDKCEEETIEKKSHKIILYTTSIKIKTNFWLKKADWKCSFNYDLSRNPTKIIVYFKKW